MRRRNLRSEGELLEGLYWRANLMQRPVGVIFTAILEILGSTMLGVLALLMCIAPRMTRGGWAWNRAAGCWVLLRVGLSVSGVRHPRDRHCISSSASGNGRGFLPCFSEAFSLLSALSLL